MSGAELTRQGGALGREELLARIDGDRPLISGYRSLEEQLQPNGFDLTVSEIGRLVGPGAIGWSNRDRVLPEVNPIPFDDGGWLSLDSGLYQVIFNEVVDLSNDLMALWPPPFEPLP